MSTNMARETSADSKTHAIYIHKLIKFLDLVVLPNKVPIYKIPKYAGKISKSSNFYIHTIKSWSCPCG